MNIAPDGWPIRRHPRIAHLMPYLRGDSLRAIWFAVHVLHRRFIDQNGNVDRDGVWWIMHWTDVIRGGYRWYWTGDLDKHGREVRKRIPKHWPRHVDRLPTHRVTLLRSRKRGGRRPHRASLHMIHWRRENITGCLEGKGTCTDAPQESYNNLVALVLSSRCRFVFMTLQSIPGWRTRLRRMHAAGVAHGVAVPLAILPRGRKPADWAEFEAMGVQVWGRWRR